MSAFLFVVSGNRKSILLPCNDATFKIIYLSEALVMEIYCHPSGAVICGTVEKEGIVFINGIRRIFKIPGRRNIYCIPDLLSPELKMLPHVNHKC